MMNLRRKLKIKLFGRKKKSKKKKYSIKNLFNIKLIESINFNEYKDHEPEIVDNRFDGVPFLPRGKFNSSIPIEKLSKLPFHLQRCWNRIDLKEYFKEPMEEPELPEMMGMTEPIPDLFQLIKDKEKRIKIKAMVFGELDDN